MKINAIEKAARCLWCLLLSFLVAGKASSAIIPDPQIQADLKGLFADPPQVQGYPYQAELEKAASRYGLPLPLVLAVARGESFFDPKTISPRGAIGIMQVMPSTAAEYGVSQDELFDPEKNIDVGVHYLSDLYARLKDPYLALAAYYCGCSGVDNESMTLRKDCDEYVRYIHSHLRTILASAGKVQASGQEQRFLLTWFDNFLDAQAFVEFLTAKVPGLRLDVFRKQVALQDHHRYQYQVLAACRSGEEREKICRKVEEATGFSFCRF